MLVLVVDEVLVQRCADRMRRCAVHLSLDDLGVDANAAVVDRRVVDDLRLPSLRVDLDEAGVDLGGVGERQLAHLLLGVDDPEVRPVDEAVVEVGLKSGGRNALFAFTIAPSAMNGSAASSGPSLIRAIPSASSI